MAEPLFRLSGAIERHPEVEAWLAGDDPMRRLAERWIQAVRDAGPDVCELLHDGRPTACVDGAAFAYVAAYSTHVSVGFFLGADLPDPAGLLEGGGKRMRHVKVRQGRVMDEAALAALIAAAHADIQARLAT